MHQTHKTSLRQFLKKKRALGPGPWDPGLGTLGPGPRFGLAFPQGVFVFSKNISENTKCSDKKHEIISKLTSDGLKCKSAF